MRVGGIVGANRKEDELVHGLECRRIFLKRALGASAAVALGRVFGPSGRTGDQVVRADELREPGAARARGATPRQMVSRVIRVRSDKLIPVRGAEQPVLRDALVLGLCGMTRTNRVEDAWHSLMKPDDVILIKFNQSGRDLIGNGRVMAEELVRSLTRSGWNPNQIMVMESEMRGDESWMRKTRAIDQRWQGETVRFGSSGSDSFCAALAEATAIINVPFLKTHHLAVMSGCLKNLSHGLIAHPSRFHAGGCDPAIGEIVSHEAIRSKLRLNLVNGLRVVFDRGAEAGEREVHRAATLLFGADPVSCDAVGYGLLGETRTLHGLGPLVGDAGIPRQLITAARLGGWASDMDVIELEEVGI